MAPQPRKATRKKAKRKPAKRKKRARQNVTNDARTSAPRVALDWADRFLDVFARTSNIKRSCDNADISRMTYYRRLKEDKEFAQAVEHANDDAVDRLQGWGWDAATVGVPEPVIYQGQLMGMWKMPNGDIVPPLTPGAVLTPLLINRRSNAVLMTLLAAHRRDVYGQHHRMEVTGKNGNPIELFFAGKSTEELHDMERRLLATAPPPPPPPGPEAA